MFKLFCAARSFKTEPMGAFSISSVILESSVTTESGLSCAAAPVASNPKIIKNPSVFILIPLERIIPERSIFVQHDPALRNGVHTKSLNPVPHLNHPPVDDRKGRTSTQRNGRYRKSRPQGPARNRRFLETAVKRIAPKTERQSGFL